LTRRRPDDAEAWLWSQLSDLARRLGIGITVRDLSDDDFPPRSGLCRVDDQWRLFVHRDLPLRERNRALAAALGRFDLEAIYVVPRLRGFIETVLAEDRVDGP